MLNIPHVQACVFITQNENAKTRPNIFRCMNESGTPCEYVVKSHHELGARITCEFVSAYIGYLLDLPIPPIAIVEIEQDVVARIPCKDAMRQLTDSSGPHFGSKLQSESYITLPPEYIPPRVAELASNIFFFDMLIQNRDRCCDPECGSSNLLVNGDGAFMIDHEAAFGFIYGEDLPQPWELRKQKWVVRHLFFNHLKRRLQNEKYHQQFELDLENFCNKLRNIDGDKLEEMIETIPGNWYNEDECGSKIVDYLTIASNSINRFAQGIREALA